MFCSKCGNKLSSDRQFCPNCGAKNINYVPPKKSRIQKDIQNNSVAYDSGVSTSNVSDKKRKSHFIIVIICAIVFIILSVSICYFVFIKKGNSAKIDDYVKKGTAAYISEDGYASFFIDNEVKKIYGDFKSARTSPDYKKIIVLEKDGKLTVKDSLESEGIEIEQNVDSIYCVNNYGVFYISQERLLYYRFDNNNSLLIETIENEDLASDYSKNFESLAFINNNSELYSYNCKESEPTLLCKIGENAKIGGISDDGTVVIWSEKKDDEVIVYTCLNGAPERIGKFKTSSNYYYLDCDFFDNGKSYIISSDDSNKMIYSDKSGTIHEIDLNGNRSYKSLVNEHGRQLYTENTDISKVYFDCSVKSNYGSVYCLNADGDLEEVISNVKLKGWAGAEYYIVKDNIYYLDQDSDLFVKNLLTGDTERITTEIDRLFIPSGGSYAYMVKSGALYCWNTKDTTHKLEMITSDFNENESVYLTDRDDVIYYTSGTMDIEYMDYNSNELKDSYYNRGMLNWYFADEKNNVPNIKGDVVYVVTNDCEDISYENPIIYSYVRMNTDDVFPFPIYNVGTFINGEYVIIAENVNRSY